jgi:hypothetical protein
MFAYRYILILTVSFFLVFEAVSQISNTKKPLIFGTKGHYGFIIPHSASIEELSHTNPFGFELNINRLNNRLKDWKQCNCYSKTGLAISYIDFANPVVLGGAANLLIYVEPFITYRPKLFFTVRLGSGISYITKVYDEKDNPANLFFSTPISFPLFIDLNAKFKLNQKLNIVLSGSYNHISNGGYRQPNKGMNFPTATLGMEYTPNAVELSKPLKAPDTIQRNPHIELNSLYTVKVHSKTDSFAEKTCHIFGLSARVTRKVSRFNAVSAGMEWIADGYRRESIRRDRLGLDYNSVAITAGHDLLVGNFAFVIQLGYYIYAPYKAMDDVYEKYDLQYRFNKRLYAGVFLKAHRHVAELMGLSVGVVL